jgi:cobalamin biosynthesis protein CbiD
MDFQKLVAGGAQGLATQTSSPSFWIKGGLSTILGAAGFVLLVYGKKTEDVQKMIWGAVLTIASFFVF